MTEKIGVDITANVSGFEQGFNQAEKRTKEFANTVEKANADITGASQKAINALGQVGKEIVTGDFSQIPETLGRAAMAAPDLSMNLLRLISPFAAVAAVAGVFAKAAHDGAEESSALANAVILSGNAAGTSADTLNDLALAVSSVTGATRGQAAAVLTQLVSTGKVAENSLDQAAQAAIRLERSGAQAAEKTVAQFAELGKAPVEASLKLNEQYNYLTVEVYRQIKALQDEGREREAAALAIKTYADAADTMAVAVDKNLGILERSWRGIGTAAKWAWDQMLDLGRDDSLDKQIAYFQKQLDIAREAQGNGTSKYLGRFGDTQELEARLNYLGGVKAAQEEATAAVRADNEARKSGIAFDQLKEQYLTKEQKLRREIAQVRQLGAAAGASEAEILKMEAAVQAKYADRAVARKTEIAEGQRLIDQLQNRLYTAEQLSEVEKLQAQLADGKYPKITAAEQDIALALAAQIDQRALIKAQLDEELSAAQKVRKEYEAQENQLQQLIGATPTGKNTERMQKEALAESALLSGRIDQKTFDEIRENLHEVKKEGEDTFGALTSAVNQWGKASAEAMVDFVFEGKASFSDLANSIIKDIMRIVVQQNITTPLAKSVASLDFSGLFASFFHTGGVAGVDAGSATRALPADLFTTAPRYHTGAIAGDEQPAVLKKGEGVFTEAQMKKLAPASGSGTTVNIINQAQGTEITQNRRQGAGGENILDVVIRTVRSNLLNDMAVGGEFASGLEGQYNLSRVAGG